MGSGERDKMTSPRDWVTGSLGHLNSYYLKFWEKFGYKSCWDVDGMCLRKIRWPRLVRIFSVHRVRGRHRQKRSMSLVTMGRSRPPVKVPQELWKCDPRWDVSCMFLCMFGKVPPLLSICRHVANNLALNRKFTIRNHALFRPISRSKIKSVCMH